MAVLHLLVKPASSSCNMRCQYCFYADVAENRATKSYGMMSLDTLEKLVQRAFVFADQECTFTFQGGEPTLVGIDFYRALIKYVEKYNRDHIPVFYCIQTNGYLIDDAWADFFAKHCFLVGVSLDGNKAVHDCSRIDSKGQGTFARIMETISKLKKYGVDYSILSTVTDPFCDRVNEIYDFYKKSGFAFQQYTPCIEGFEKDGRQTRRYLSPEKFGQFLNTLFDRWYADIRRGEAPSIRYFDNLYLMMRNQMPESCGMLGICSVQNVVESDGSVYPCDFYVLDCYRLGNIREDSLEEIYQKRKEIQFIEDSYQINQKCMICKWFMICRGGCRRYRNMGIGQDAGFNYFCESYKMFFEHSFERLSALAENRDVSSDLNK